MADEEGWIKVKSRSQKRTPKPHSTEPTTVEYQDYGFDHQDWKPRVLNGGSVPKPKGRSLDTPKKKVNVDRTMQRLEEKAEEGDLHIERPTLELAQAIQNARNAKGWKQKDLANNCNVPLSVIQSYENRTAPVDGQMIGILSRVLGVKLSNKREKKH